MPNRFDIENNFDEHSYSFYRKIKVNTGSTSSFGKFTMNTSVSYYPANCGLAILHSWSSNVPFDALKNNNLSLSKKEYEWIWEQYSVMFFDDILQFEHQKPYFEATAIRHENIGGIIERVLGIEFPSFEKVLDRCPYAEEKYTFTNPNSDNKIGVWLIENPFYSTDDEDCLPFVETDVRSDIEIEDEEE